VCYITGRILSVMESLPEELLIQVISYLTIPSDRVQLCLTSSHFTSLVAESWLDVVRKYQWKRIEKDSTWLDVCIRYSALKNAWFSGKLSRLKIVNSDQIESIAYNGKLLVTHTTDDKLSFWSIEGEKVQRISHEDEAIEDNSLTLTESNLGYVDSRTFELVIVNTATTKSVRCQLDKMPFNVDHCLSNNQFIVVITDKGVIYSVKTKTLDLCRISLEIDDICTCYLKNEFLVVSSWSDNIALVDLNQPYHPRFIIPLDYTAFCVFIYSNFVYFGKDDGQIGKIPIKRFDAVTEKDMVLFGNLNNSQGGKQDLVYCINANKSVIVSGSGDSEVVFWSHEGFKLKSDNIVHIGVVRHIYLNDWLCVTGGDAHKIIIWDPVTFLPRFSLHHNPVKVRFMFCGTQSIVYGSPDSNLVMLLNVQLPIS